MKIIGLMSGTSGDGVDAALVEVRSHKGKLAARLLAFTVYKIPSRTRQRIFQLFHDSEGSLSLTCQLNFELGEIFAQAALALMKKADVRAKDIAAIGSHGQTAYHIPPTMAKPLGLTPSTLQIGDASVIALRTGITTVADFRTADMAVGGEGAPLIPFADFHLLSHARRTRIVQNIGGIANCTLLPAGCEISDVLAFDTGPGNMVIDALVRIATQGKRHFDKDGTLARQGKVNENLLKKYLNHPYFKLLPPKTTGRELFGEQFARKFFAEAQKRKIPTGDTIATATALTAESIVVAYENFLMPILGAGRRIDEVVLGGGGPENKTLVAMMRKRLSPETRLLKHEDLGINGKAKEAIAFALLAYACLNHIPANVPPATGAGQAVILGKVYDASQV